ncbi:MAG: hypothetical protein JXA33_28295 [Anaerolineae bacterium]|nr:hypothetical protein [Anaerolineae bacterium]
MITAFRAIESEDCRYFTRTLPIRRTTAWKVPSPADYLEARKRGRVDAMLGGGLPVTERPTPHLPLQYRPIPLAEKEPTPRALAQYMDIQR